MIIAKPPQHLKGLIHGTCSAGNLGNMLLIIVPAVCKEKGTPFGDSDVCAEYGMAYASLSMAVWMAMGQVPSILSSISYTRKFVKKILVRYNNVFLLKIVGFVIGTIATFRRLLIGTTAPLGVLQDSVVGDAAIPAVTSIVGGNLLRGLKGSGISLTLVLGIATVRYIFLPVFGILIVEGALYSGLVHQTLSTSLFFSYISAFHQP
ncbi:hypothetical protein HanXRQr2_Chr07g0293521 [Helianthus annuus]|uniref:Uncharacterized protein n=2 Tax=Helianthus annuus TaxID=4232 RepID=A0A9K3IL24_HELAN|nr:hypothetical protein HanXRQr2_Chr07g0293521 [Helianthus annuus]KAJ0904607.1 hypothetical protein HanPSC8_Chr07g0284191 [Helianthus annuus]